MFGTDSSRTAPRRRRTMRRRLAIGAAVVLVPIVIGLALLHTGPARRHILDRVTALLAEQGINVQADDLRFNLLDLSVNLERVTVEAVATPGAPFASIGNIDADLSLTDLLGGRYVVESARIDDLDVHYLVYEDGSDNVPRPPDDPNASGEPIDYLIEHGRIANANIHYEDRAADLDLTLPVRLLTIEGSRVSGRHLVALEAGNGRLLTEGRQVPVDALTGELDLGRNDVRIQTLVLESGDARAELTGTVDDFSNPALDVRMQAALGAARAVELAGVTDPVSGRVSVDARASGPVDALRVAASIEGRDLSYRDLQSAALDLEAEYDVATGIARANRLDLDAPWGELTGTATVATDGAGRSSATLAASGVDAGGLMRALDVTPVAATRVDARVEATWPGLDYAAASGDATVTLQPTAARPAPGVLPVGGRLTVTARDGRIVTDVQGIEAAGVDVTGQVTLANRERLDGVLRARTGDAAATIAMVEALTDQPAGTLLPEGTSGTVAATATLGGTVSSPVVRTALDATWGEARAHAEGRVGLATDEPLSLTFEVTSLDVASLLAAAGQNASTASGTLSLTGTADGTLDQPRVNASLTGRDLVVSGEALGVLTADAHLEGSQATVERLVLDKPQPDGNGRLIATGTYDLDTEAYAFTVDSENLAITSLTLPDGRPVRGQVTLDASGQGTLDSPAASIDLSATTLTFADHALGSVTIDADVSDDAATATLTADRFGLAADVRAGISAPYPATVEARVTSLNLADLPLDLQTALTGSLTAQIDAAGDLSEPSAFEGRARLEAVEGTWNGQPFALDGPADIRLADERVSIEGLAVTAQDSRVSVSGTVPLDAEAGTGVLELDARANLSTLAGYAPADMPVSAEGTLTLAGTIAGNLERLDPTIDLRIADGTILIPDLPQPVTGVDVQARLADGVASVDQLDGQWGATTFTALARMPLAFLPDLPVALPPGSGQTTLSASVTDFSPAAVPGSPDDLDGAVSLEFEATAASPDLGAVDGLVTFSELGVSFDSLTLTQDQPSAIRVANGLATIERLALSGSAGTITARGSVGLTGQRALDLGVDGDLNVATVTALTDAVRADGRAALNLTAQGTVAAPELAGALTLSDGIVTVDEPSIYAESLAARVGLSGNRITLESLSGTLNGGTLSGRGGLTIAGGEPSDVNVEISATNVALEAPLDLRSLSDTTLTIAERDENIVVSGRVRILEAGLTGDLNFDTGLLATLAAPRALDLTEERNALVERVRFDIDVVTESPIIVDNNLARAEVTADLRLLGTPYETGLSGRLQILEGGQITLNERSYAVDRGTITFLDDRRIVPSMDLRLTTTAGRYDVTLGVTGEPGETETTLVSNPTLPEPDIMALLVTGRTLEDMRGEEYDVAREQVLSYLAGRLGSSLGRDIEQATGLSEVRLEPNLIASEADPSARLTIAQELTRALTLIFSTDLGDSSDQIWVGRYDVTRRFDTSATRQSDGTYRFDLRHDVRAGGQPAPEQTPRSRPEVASLTVDSDGAMSESEARALLGVEAGDEYDYFAVHEGVRDIEAELRDRGRLESRVRLERTVEDASADLVLSIREGPVVSLAFEGATPPADVVREVRRQWSRGVFDRQRADDAMEALRIWLIDERHYSPEVDYRVEEPAPGSRRVVFRLDPGPRFDGVDRVFEGAAGVEPDVLNEIIEEQDLAREVFTDPVVVTTLLERYYREEGFLVAEVDQPEYEFSGSVARVVMTVREGPRFTVGDVTVQGNTVMDDAALVGDLPIVAGDPYLPRVAARALDRIRDLYWDRAYNDVRSDYTLATDRDAARVDVMFSIEEGQRSIVDEVAIAGSDETSERLVREQFELEPGDPLDLSLLARSRRNLYGTGAFSIVDVTRTDAAPEDGDGDQPAPTDKPVDVTVAVREVQPHQLRYGVSFDTERGLGGVVDVSNHNSLGKARVVGLSGRYDGQLREARVYFGQPSLLYFPVETTASVYYRDERNPATAITRAFDVERLGASVQQERLLADSYVWTYGYRYERGRKSSVVAGLPTTETVIVSPLTSTFLRETRDELLDATTGSFTSHALSYSPSWLGADTSYVRYYGQYFKYFPLEAPQRKRFTNEILRPRFVFATGVRLGLAWSPTTVPETERFYAGGSTTLRGFEQNAVGPIGPEGVPTGGQALFVLNNEVRVPLISIVDGVGFLDVGNVFRRAGDFSFGDLRETAGIGLRVRTPWFLLRGDYGFILDLRPGERRSRFYFSIGQAF